MSDELSSFLSLERSVKPKVTKPKGYPVVAVHNGDVLSEDGELLRLIDIIPKMKQWRSTVFASTNSGDFLATLDDHFKKSDPNEWQYRLSNYERSIVRPDGRKVAARVTVVVPFFGWKNGSFHRMIDPVSMYGHRLDTIWPGDEDIIFRLLKWGIQIRDFCAENEIDVRPTIGAVSAQLLVSPKFYPKARRKVPAAINKVTRAYQPGNYYQLLVSPGELDSFTAHYLDQSRSHHYHARTGKLPDSNHLYAYGHFRNLDNIAWDHTVKDFYGLYCLDLIWQRNGQRAYGWIKGYEREYTRQFVWSNELEHLRDMGFTVTGVRAAWGSRKQDTGLAKYATWSEAQLDRYQNAPWLKPLLLSAYGVLATKPRYAEAVFRLASKGEPVTVVTGNKKVEGFYTKSQMKLEPGIANVLHRGMIEAGCRSESVGMAQWLASLGHQILSIYADAVIVKEDADRQLPLLPEPWRLKNTLTHLQFINTQAFTSNQMTKMPGVVGRDILKYVRTSPAPRRSKVSVAELMEQEELVNTLITQHQGQ